MSEKSDSVISSFMWRFAERCGAQGVSFIVEIILARLLAPGVYGTIAIILVFINIMQVFVDSGLGNALIQKKDADELDFSSVFFFNLLMCSILYIIMFCVAPIIAGFYNNQNLIPIIRVLSLTLIISGVKNVQQAYVTRNLLFKRFFFSTLGGTIGAAFVGVYMAYKGCGVWALVGQHLFNTTVDTIILWLTVKWKPKRMFSLERLKKLFSYGWKLLASSLLENIYNNICQLVIGKLYSSTDLAYYNRGKVFPDTIISNINSSIDSVLFPTMSKVQDDRIKVKMMTRMAIKTSTYIMAPLMMGLTFCSKQIVDLILTGKWDSCIPYMCIFCITSLFYPIHTANLNAIKAMGRSDCFLKLEILKKIVGITLLLLTMWHGVMAMAYSLLISSVLSQIINSWPNRTLLGYGYLEQIKDIFPSLILSVIMGVCVYSISLIGLSDIATLSIQIVMGALIYIVGSKVFKFQEFEYVLAILKKLEMRDKERK